MSAKDNKPLEVNGVLIEGTHDALIELRNTYGGRHANQLLLHVGDALVERYPLLLSDMHATPESGLGKSVQIKIRINAQQYPRLAKAYHSIGRGLRGIAMINLLNRLYMIGENDPGQVEAIVHERLRASSAQALASGAFRNDQDHVPSPSIQNDQGIEGSRGAGTHLESQLPEEAISEEIFITAVPSDLPGGSLLTAEDDPLNGLDLGFMS